MYSVILLYLSLCLCCSFPLSPFPTHVIIRGFADVYVSMDSLPSATNYFLKETDVNKSADRVGRIVSKNNGYLGQLFIAVHSPETGAKFELWAMCSGASSSVSDTIASVSKTVRGLQILGNYDPETLHVKLPHLRTLAHNIAESESLVSRQSILSQLQQSLSGDSSGSIADIPRPGAPGAPVDDDSDDEFEVLNRFVQKVGRRAMKKEMASRGGYVKKSTGESPFMHADMFFKPNVESRTHFESVVVRPITPVRTAPGSAESSRMGSPAVVTTDHLFSLPSSPPQSAPRGVPHVDDASSRSGSVAADSASRSASRAADSESYVDLYLSRSNTLPRLAKTPMEGSRPTTSNKERGFSAKSPREPASPLAKSTSLPQLVRASGSGSVSSGGGGGGGGGGSGAVAGVSGMDPSVKAMAAAEAKKAAAMKRSESFLKITKTPTVVNYSLRKYK